MGASPSKVEAGLYKGWKRISEIGRYWPKNKYGFSQYLVKVGDWIESHDMPKEDMVKMEFAACAWAFHKKKTIKLERQRRPNKQYALRITLIKQHRNRDFG